MSLLSVWKPRWISLIPGSWHVWDKRFSTSSQSHISLSLWGRRKPVQALHRHLCVSCVCPVSDNTEAVILQIYQVGLKQPSSCDTSRCFRHRLKTVRYTETGMCGFYLKWGGSLSSNRSLSTLSVWNGAEIKNRAVYVFRLSADFIYNFMNIKYCFI